MEFSFFYFRYSCNILDGGSGKLRAPAVFFPVERAVALI
jgi:hypothetical protein